VPRAVVWIGPLIGAVIGLCLALLFPWQPPKLPTDCKTIVDNRCNVVHLPNLNRQRAEWAAVGAMTGLIGSAIVWRRV
jgi:hypothetical protein